MMCVCVCVCSSGCFFFLLNFIVYYLLFFTFSLFHFFLCSCVLASLRRMRRIAGSISIASPRPYRRPALWLWRNPWCFCIKTWTISVAPRWYASCLWDLGFGRLYPTPTLPLPYPYQSLSSGLPISPSPSSVPFLKLVVVFSHTATTHRYLRSLSLSHTHTHTHTRTHAHSSE
jgi:hypothetical protein